MIAIIDYGMGNLGSVFNMLKRIKAEAKITSDPEIISKADKILLPGVGAFDSAVKKIKEIELWDLLNHRANVEKIPVLGICLGMQLLTESSEEGKLEGFGWIPANTIKFKFEKELKLKIPHMGWNLVEQVSENSIISDLPEEPRFYFVHSYYVKVKDEKYSLLKTNYGHPFDSGILKDNIFGAQFHPEKSHKFGMKFLENFAKL